jgi:signal transduction histidine kinase
MKRSRLTIRARITGGSVLIAILISIAAGIVIYNQVQRIVSSDQIRVLDSVEGQYLTAIRDGDTEEMDPPGPGQFVAVTDPAGIVAVNTLPAALSAKAAELGAKSDGVRTIQGEETAYLVQTRRVDAGQGSWQVVTASAKDDQVLNQVAYLLIASIAGINIAFGAAAWLIGSAALNPVTQLRRSAADLVTQPGSELLPVGPARDEISDLATTLNELISQLRASADRERQIVSDASHEFRTPLAIIQTRLELAQRHATTLEEMRADVSAAQKTLARLSSLATSMLELSRIDAQGQPGSATVAELAMELADAADRARYRAAGRDIRIDYDQDAEQSDDRVAVSEADFGRVCDNLMSNALSAITGSGAIQLSLRRESDCLRLTVLDDAGGMADTYVPFAFDRFSRQSASRTSGGAGLGLSIVAGIASMAGGTVGLDNTPGIGLRVDVTFPLLNVGGAALGGNSL